MDTIGSFSPGETSPDEEVIIVEVWEKLLAIRELLTTLIEMKSPRVRRYGMFLALFEREMSYFYYFLFRKHDGRFPHG